MILEKYDSTEALGVLLRHVVGLRAERRLHQNPADACQLISALRATIHLDGDIAEVGTASGGSARLISEYSEGKAIHCFDTFSGMPTPGKLDNRFNEGSYRYSLESVSAYLHGRKIEFHAGTFPDSAVPVRNHRFCFVHLDADLYQSTLDSLEFFYPRMNPGGIMITHDYTWAKGVNQAFAEFFMKKPEKPIELIGDQAMVVKLS